MDWLKRVAFNAIKGEIKKRMEKFTWSSREVDDLKKKGFTDSDIHEREGRSGGRRFVAGQAG